MTQISYNCMVCAKEFNSEELLSIATYNANIASFKICHACIDCCDPAEDYREVRDIVNSYLKFTEAKCLFSEVKDILNFRNKKLK